MLIYITAPQMLLVNRRKFENGLDTYLIIKSFGKIDKNTREKMIRKEWKSAISEINLSD